MEAIVPRFPQCSRGLGIAQTRAGTGIEAQKGVCFPASGTDLQKNVEWINTEGRDREGGNRGKTYIKPCQAAGVSVPQTAGNVGVQGEQLRTAHTARYWIVLLPDGNEVLRRWQEPVDLTRVLSEHRSAVAAWPVEGSV